jgi:hypothetical protein
MSTTTPHSTPAAENRTPLTLARLVGGAARGASRRPKLTIFLWLALVVGCLVAGGLSGTHQLSNAASGTGESAAAEARLHSAGLVDPASERIMVTARSRAQTATAVAALQRRARRSGPSPPVLADRGLEAAVQSLADRAGSAVTVNAEIPRPPPPVVETAAYFVVAEALTNAAKHAPEAAVRITLWAEHGGPRPPARGHGRPAAGERDRGRRPGAGRARAAAPRRRPQTRSGDLRRAAAPGFSDEGVRAALEARRRHPELAVLVLSQYVEPAYSR